MSKVAGETISAETTALEKKNVGCCHYHIDAVVSLMPLKVSNLPLTLLSGFPKDNILC